MKRNILIALTILIINLPLQMAGFAGKGGPRMGNAPGGNSGDVISALPYEDLSDFETAAIQYMREEEKLARDTYLALFEVWGSTIFQSIASSEQRHMDAVYALLEKYDLPDPAEEAPGVFSIPELQELYNLLVATGNQSVIDALWVGATIEDLDISDLQVDLEQVDNADIKVVFGNLLNGSKNHLRAYTRLLSLNGVAYEAQYLSTEEVENIIDTSSGKVARRGNASGMNSASRMAARGTSRRVSYSQDELVELTGIVTTVNGALGEDNASFTLDETVAILAGPYRLWIEAGFELQTGDEVTVLVVPCSMSPDVWVAVHVTNLTTGATLTLRSEQGSSGGKGNRASGRGQRGTYGG